MNNIRINGKKCSIEKDSILGSELKVIGDIPLYERLVIEVKDEPDIEIINENFYGIKSGMILYSDTYEKSIKIIIDDKEYVIDKEFITGRKLKERAGLSISDYKLIQEVKDGADRIIEDNIEYEIEKGDRFFAMPTGISNGGM